MKADQAKADGLEDGNGDRGSSEGMDDDDDWADPIESGERSKIDSEAQFKDQDRETELKLSVLLADKVLASQRVRDWLENFESESEAESEQEVRIYFLFCLLDCDALDGAHSDAIRRTENLWCFTKRTPAMNDQ